MKKREIFSLWFLVLLSFNNNKRKIKRHKFSSFPMLYFYIFFLCFSYVLPFTAVHIVFFGIVVFFFSKGPMCVQFLGNLFVFLIEKEVYEDFPGWNIESSIH